MHPQLYRFFEISRECANVHAWLRLHCWHMRYVPNPMIWLMCQAPLSSRTVSWNTRIRQPVWFTTQIFSASRRRPSRQITLNNVASTSMHVMHRRRHHVVPTKRVFWYVVVDSYDLASITTYNRSSGIGEGLEQVSIVPLYLQNLFWLSHWILHKQTRKS